MAAKQSRARSRPAQPRTAGAVASVATPSYLGDALANELSGISERAFSQGFREILNWAARRNPQATLEQTTKLFLHAMRVELERAEGADTRHG